MTNWLRPKEKAKVAANKPNACVDKPNSCCKPVAIIAVTVRKAWLSAKALTRASKGSQGTAAADWAGDSGEADMAGTGNGIRPTVAPPSVLHRWSRRV